MLGAFNFSPITLKPNCLQGEMYDAFTKMAAKQDDIAFVQTASADVASKIEGLAAGGVAVVTNHKNEPRSEQVLKGGPFTAMELELGLQDLIKVNKVPPTVEFGPEASSLVRAAKRFIVHCLIVPKFYEIEQIE